LKNKGVSPKYRSGVECFILLYRSVLDIGSVEHSSD